VNKALVLENRRGIMDRKKKQECRGQSSNNSRLRVGIPFTGPIQRTPQQQPRTRLQQRPQVTMQGYQTPQCQFIQHPNITQTAAPGSQILQRQQSIQRPVQNPRDGRCYNCCERGHFASACPKPRNRPNQTSTTNATPNRNGNPTPVAAR
jgi:hypothetical protein